VKISAKTEYACIAMMELAASHGSGEPGRIRKIADQHGVPSRFLVQILLQLKGAGLVTSTRGASGGYQLAKAPGEITLWKVISVNEGQDEQLTSNVAAPSPSVAALLAVWQEIADAQREMLEAVTLADLVERAAAEGQANMYYI
jgi:Rrf2 family protein